MFEGAVAAFLNRLLGRYVEDLDTEQFNVGIFSGDTFLTDLKLKPEALYQLGLPIRVEIGLIGKISLKIPWAGLFSQPVVLWIEDIHIVAVSEVSYKYDAEIHKRLTRAAKRKILEDLDGNNFLGSGLPLDIIDNILTSIVKNFQITINNVHIRYEEALKNNSLTACGICLQSLSLATTNNKWKPGVTQINSSSIYQLVRAESLCVYLDPETKSALSSSPLTWDFATLLIWKDTMRRALQTFAINENEFQFVVKPFTTKIKLIFSKGNETKVSRMLIDIVLQDIALQISKQQYTTLNRLYRSLQRGSIRRLYLKYRPNKEISKDTKAWWKYAYNVVLENNVRPYTWAHLKACRANYKQYKQAYMQTLLQPNDTELKLDLQKYEDLLPIFNIVIAREHAKMELKKKHPERVSVEAKESDEVRLVVNYDKMQEIQKTNRETKKFFGALSEDFELKPKLYKLIKHTDRKCNFTLANCSVTLLHNDREVLIITLAQFLASMETRPESSAFKISARAESFSFEGISMENDLVSLVTADNILTGNACSNFLAIDFEKNPPNYDSNYDITVTLEPIEVTYHSYALSEVINFFNIDDTRIQKAACSFYDNYMAIKDRVVNFIDCLLSRNLRINLKLDIKGPYIVFPEHGSLQEEGYVFLLDLGRMTLKTELQAVDSQLEDATLMELEELLYDRVHLDFSGGQILLCHTGDDWRETRKRKESEHHLVPKLQANVTISSSIKPEYRVLPRMKLNVSISQLKLNLSESKFQILMEFMDKLSIPTTTDIEKFCANVGNTTKKPKADLVFTSKDLGKIRSVIALSSVVTEHDKSRCMLKDLPNCNSTETTRSVISSEISEEDLEQWFRSCNFSGFDDNVTNNNHINVLLRFVIGELAFHFESVTASGRAKPYLICKLCSLYLEIAKMDYGYALQSGINTLLVADKTEAGVTGSYLELISTDDSCEFLTSSYRKIKANCPEFKSHFRSVERSLVVNITNLNIVFHRQAFLKLKQYYENLYNIFHGKLIYRIVDVVEYGVSVYWKRENDPPIPLGAIKLSYSVRLGTFILKLSGKDSDLLLLKLVGIENDCIYNANERMIFRAHLRSISIKDLADITLYSKILVNDEDDKVFDLKYVRHAPKLYKCSDIDSNPSDVTSNGSFKLSIGRINYVFVSKMIHDCQHFFHPFGGLHKRFRNYGKSLVLWSIEEFKRSETKLCIFIHVQGPTLLLPQKKDVPTLLVFDMGTLSIENFFKKSQQQKHSSMTNGSDTCTCIVDNILLKLKSVTLSRAIMTLGGNLEIQEPIIEPVHTHFDIKRKMLNGTKSYQGLCNIQSSIDLISINLGQKDLASALSIWEDNLSKAYCTHKKFACHADLLKKPKTKSVPDDLVVKKLEAFFSQSENPLCQVSFKTTFEGLQLNLFSDTDEVLSSPVRDLSHELGKLIFGETSLSLDLYSDKSMNVKVSIRSCELEDVRKNAAVVKRIIQSPAKQIGINSESRVYVSMPPAVDLCFTRRPTGETCFDMLVEESRVNLSIPFLTQLGHYFVDSIPCEQAEEGVVNQGYEGSEHTQDHYQCEACNLSNNVDESSSIFDVSPEQQSGSSVSIRIRKPELMLFGDLKTSNAHAILFKAEVMLESSRHKGSSSIICTLSDIRAKSKSQERYLRQSPRWLLRPCDIEICRKETPDSQIGVVVAVSPVNLHLSVGTINTFIEILNDIISFFKKADFGYQPVTTSRDFGPYVDLWSPKKVCSIPYRQADHDALDKKAIESVNAVPEKTLELKSVSVRVLLEMEQTIERIPILKVEAEVSAYVSDLESNFQLQSSLKLYSFCYNVNRGVWEPFLELCQNGNSNQYKPWQLNLTIFQAESHPVNSWLDQPRQSIEQNNLKKKKRYAESSEDELEKDMVFIPPDYIAQSKISELNCNFEHDEDTESEDDATTNKNVRAFKNLFIKGSDDEEDTDSDASSKYEDEGFELTPECTMESRCPPLDSNSSNCSRATYVIVSSSDKLNFTVSPNTLVTLDMILDTFSKCRTGIPIVAVRTGKLNLHNDIGHDSRVEFIVKEESNGKSENRVVAIRDSKDHAASVSAPNTPESEPTSNASSPTAVFNVENELVNGNLEAKDYELTLFPEESLVDVYARITKEQLRIVVEGFEDTLVYSQKKQGYNLIPLRPMKHGVRYHVAVETSTDFRLHRTVTVRSPLEIRNETTHALALHYKKQLQEKLGIAQTGQPLNPFDENIRLAILEPDETYHVPLFVAYHFPIYLLPAHLDEFRVSDEGIYWREMSQSLYVSKDIHCRPKSEEADTRKAVFSVKAMCTRRRGNVNTCSQVPEYLIKILTPMILDNKLPFILDVSIPNIHQEIRVEPGEHISIYSVRCDSEFQIVFKIQNYLGIQWCGSCKMKPTLQKKFIKMTSDSETDFIKPFLLCLDFSKSGSWVINIYTQYWIINKTGLPLNIRESFTNACLEIPGDELVVFSQKECRRKRTVRLKAQQSGWSPSFRLDGVSPMSLILCRDVERRRKYRILVEISISRLAPLYTKIVTFLPYFYIENTTKRALRFMEENEEADLWNDLLPGQGVAFWPNTESMMMRVKWKNSQLVSQHFDITKVGNTVLRMDNGSALCVNISGGDTLATHITFRKYQAGDSPVRIDNLCSNLFLKINQINLGQATLLNPFQSLLYTWDDPSKARELIWNIYNGRHKGYVAQFLKDGYGQEVVPLKSLKNSKIAFSKKIDADGKMSIVANVGGSSSEETDSEADLDISGSDQVKHERAAVFWVSYMEDEQRVLLFTQDENIFMKAKNVIDPEPSEWEFFLSLAGIGISFSIASCEESRELAYASISDSAAHWEVCIGQSWRSLTLELSAWMEEKYANSYKKAQFEDFIDVDLSKMYMMKPFFGKLRRTYSPGIWLHLRKSATLSYVQGYVNKFQVDNQMHDVPFPVILYSISGLNCLTNDTIGNRKLKHCVEFCCLKQRRATYDIYKDVNLLIREFNLNLQEDFLMHLLDNLIQKRLETKHSIAARLKKDLSAFHASPVPIKDINEGNRDIVQYLYISPITMQLRLLANAKDLDDRGAHGVSDYGSTVKFIFDYACRGAFEKEAQFRLFCYEKASPLSVKYRQSLHNLWNYYTAQIMQQFNVLVLSMTAVGNPYGHNFKSPSNQFYEADSISIHGDQIGEKLSFDIACYLGFATPDMSQPSMVSFHQAIEFINSIACSKSTSTSNFENKEEPVTKFSIDDSFSIDMEPEFSGLVVKPTDNIHQEELKYFFRTLSKRIRSLAKQTNGATLQFHPGLIMDTIKRAQEMGYKFISRIRLPRHIDQYMGIELYSIHKAQGLYLLNCLSKGNLNNRNKYWAHAALSEDGKRIALISLQKIYLVSKQSPREVWNVEWSIDVNRLTCPPVVENHKLVLHVTNDEKLLSPAVDWHMDSQDTRILQWLCARINAVMVLNMENGTCSSNDA